MFVFILTSQTMTCPLSLGPLPIGWLWLSHDGPAQQKSTNYRYCILRHYFRRPSIQLIRFLYFVVNGWTNYSQPRPSIQSYPSSFSSPDAGLISYFLAALGPTGWWIGSNETQLDELITPYLRFIPQVAVENAHAYQSGQSGSPSAPWLCAAKFIAPHCTYMQFLALSIPLPLIGPHVTVLKVMWTLLLINKKMYVPRT